MDAENCCLNPAITDPKDLISFEYINPEVLDLIKKDPRFQEGSRMVSLGELNLATMKYIQGMIQKETSELSSLEEEVKNSLENQELISEDLNQTFQSGLTFGQRVADKVADFGGSWTFILMFGTSMAIWIGINVFFSIWRFDPYPFILLNLLLSTLAAIQAPIIMMSQNRQEAKDRARSEMDYKINLKAELEIRHLHEKIDHILKNQWRRLTEIQQIQMQMMQILGNRK
ncbi:DUF1003 domain-containing protein [Leptospira andrefontaineae]|uniref:DUF1003 domain-containing protein n=1 Tax=Leptospira andrefontaineae TaxID=2484976 RepID=A0A4R9HD39_9LEPT|nr:DUF1003 domain-containing protein [Leptospira andrefontaineae]TGK44541.1 DUF1003 domain-containing protein [Leptospira andrefontaineae]